MPFVSTLLKKCFNYMLHCDQLFCIKAFWDPSCTKILQLKSVADSANGIREKFLKPRRSPWTVSSRRRAMMDGPNSEQSQADKEDEIKLSQRKLGILIQWIDRIYFIKLNSLFEFFYLKHVFAINNWCNGQS